MVSARSRNDLVGRFCLKLVDHRLGEGKFHAATEGFIGEYRDCNASNVFTIKRSPLIPVGRIVADLGVATAGDECEERTIQNAAHASRLFICPRHSALCLSLVYSVIADGCVALGNPICVRPGGGVSSDHFGIVFRLACACSASGEFG